jgi:diguanylate cyclase (GGDEF)-like protein
MESLFATLYQQTQRVLGKTCGFYIVTNDSERHVARLAYHVDFQGSVTTPDVTFDPDTIEAMQLRRAIVDDKFTRSAFDDVVNSISVPLIRNDEMLGVLGVYARKARTHDERDAQALSAIAELGAFVIENARVVKQMEHARHEAERLEEIGRAISSSLDLPKVLRCVVDAAVALLNADSATVWLLRNSDEVEVAMTTGEIAPKVGMVMPVPAGMKHRMADLREPYFVYEDIKEGDHDLPLELRNLTKARSSVAVALIAQEQILGALSIGHKELVKYTPRDIQLLERLSFQAAIAVANARLHEQIHTLSLTDPLTEMPNRRHLQMFLEKEFAAAKRGRALSLLLVDLDHFKKYNDRHGHRAGDAVLRVVGNIMVKHTRQMNLAARYGGDEFVAILSDTDRAGAEAHALRLKIAIEADPLLAQGGVCASVGIGSYQPEMISVDDLFHAADQDLYEQKERRASNIA